MEKKKNLLSPVRWGLTEELVKDLGQRVHKIWDCFRDCFTTIRHDTSENALTYMKGQLTMDKKRTYKQIAQAIEGSDSDGQNLQQFMSDSPWSATAVFDQIQAEIKLDARLQNGGLSLDESGDGCAGHLKAGASSQYLGSLGKVDLGQVGVCLGYHATFGQGANLMETWMMVDAELFLPNVWFDEVHQKLHQRLHIPSDRKYQTKLEIGLSLIDRAIAHRLPFDHITCDSLYGRDHDFRARLGQRGLSYLADIPCSLKTYLEEPQTGIPTKTPGVKGRSFSRPRVLNSVTSKTVKAIAAQPETRFQMVKVRSGERGELLYECAERTVWTIAKKGGVQKERLFIRKEHDGSLSYSLSNADPDIPLETLAQWRSERYFVERVFQDAKSEAGWDDLQAIKYRAWMHHSAISALTLWFITQTRLDWSEIQPRDENLLQSLAIEKLPGLSMANIRLLLQVVMPVKQLTVNQAIDLVTKLLVDRALSTSSRVKKQRQNSLKPAPG